MNKLVSFALFVVVLLIILAVAYTSFSSVLSRKSTTTITYGTSITSASTTAPTTINYSNSFSPCASFQLVGQQLNSTYVTRCNSTGGTLGLWVAGGNSGRETVKIVGADGKTYVSQSSSYNCTTFYQNFTAPKQMYTISFTTGPGGGSCGNPSVIINTTTLPPLNVYKYIYNGNFGTGTYSGWNVSNPGFGTAPLNITYADSKLCYQGTPWANYNGTFFATTYNCGITIAPGNITSAAFLVDPAKPFLNFRAISPSNNQIYVELFRQNYKAAQSGQLLINTTPVVIAYINTYNLSVSLNSSSTFANVSIPLTSYINQVLKIRVVSGSVATQSYIAIGDFMLSRRPNQQKGIAVNITTLSH